MCSKTPKIAEEHFRHGIDCLDAQDYDGTIAGFTEVIRLRPDNISSFQNGGGAWLETGAFDEAMADYSKMPEADGENTVALHNRGLAFASKAMHEKAIADFTEVIRIAPGFASAYFNRAASLQEQGSTDKER